MKKVMKTTYESPKLIHCNLEIEAAFLAWSGLTMQVDEHISNGYDSANASSTSQYMINFDDDDY